MESLESIAADILKLSPPVALEDDEPEVWASDGDDTTFTHAGSKRKAYALTSAQPTGMSPKKFKQSDDLDDSNTLLPYVPPGTFNSTASAAPAFAAPIPPVTAPVPPVPMQNASNMAPVPPAVMGTATAPAALPSTTTNTMSFPLRDAKLTWPWDKKYVVLPPYTADSTKADKSRFVIFQLFTSRLQSEDMEKIFNTMFQADIARLQLSGPFSHKKMSAQFRMSKRTTRSGKPWTDADYDQIKVAPAPGDVPEKAKRDALDATIVSTARALGIQYP